MKGKDYFFAVLTGGLYILFFTFLGGHATTLGDPTPWYEFWGRSNVSAISWLQIMHSLGVLIAAVPFAAIFIWRYRSDWLQPTLIVVIVACSFVLYTQVRGVWILADFGMQPSFVHLVSGALDIIKVGLIFFLVTAFLNRIIAIKKNRKGVEPN